MKINSLKHIAIFVISLFFLAACAFPAHDGMQHEADIVVPEVTMPDKPEPEVMPAEESVPELSVAKESEAFSDLVAYPNAMYYYSRGTKTEITAGAWMDEIFDLVVLGFSDYGGVPYELEYQPSDVQSAYDTGVLLEFTYDETVTATWKNFYASIGRLDAGEEDIDMLYEYDKITIIMGHDNPEGTSLEGMVLGLGAASGPFLTADALREKLDSIVS